MNAARSNSPERPLSGSAKVNLSGRAGAHILVCYAFSLVSVLLLLVWVGVEFALLLGAARFGLAGFVARTLRKDLALLRVFLRSFWLRKGVQFQIKVAPEEAPGLFEMIEGVCNRAQLKSPSEVYLEMNVTAWVRLHGYRRGAGRTTLGVGYDLLAGLSRAETEAVFAHEIMHAKLVQRGYKRWITGGVARMSQLAGGLSALVPQTAKGKGSITLTQLSFRCADALTRSAARAVAACSRQDEFDADRGAAGLCGSALLQSALLKLEGLDRCTARLPWSERVAQFQSSTGRYSEWLAAELATAAHHPEADSPSHRYSTHPSIKDRVAALQLLADDESAAGLSDEPSARLATPGDAGAESLSGLSLLAKPDQVAERLVSEIQRLVAEEEQKDSRRLRRWARKASANTRSTHLQLVGVGILMVGSVVGLVLLFGAGQGLAGTLTLLGGIGLGVLCCRWGGYREQFVLGVPDYAALKAAWRNPVSMTGQEVKQMEADLRAEFADRQKGRRGALALAAESYSALERCDYVRAWLAAQLSLQTKRETVDAALGLLVSAAALGQEQHTRWVFDWLQQKTGFKGVSTSWATAWALTLLGEWAQAEAFLEQALTTKANHPTLITLLALCQAQRGKLQSAIVYARRACSPQPPTKEHAKVLIDLLLQAGFRREARERLLQFQAELTTDDELMLSMVHLCLLSRDFTTADAWSDLVRKRQPGGQPLVRLGEWFETARQREKAAAFYQEALGLGHYPEALLGLARFESEINNKHQASDYCLQALNLSRPLGPKAVGPLPLLQSTLGQLVSLEEPVPNCRAWVARFDGQTMPAGLANVALLIYAPERRQADAWLKRILVALQPNAALSLGTHITWSQVPKEQQPDVPVRPGVQGLVS